ncbi:hypothetical protein FGO68_gene1279 [Halteria grandinella]|uniref:Uncharacterized protein n=1 Tax=Halteria grandinella TaxID=5974 RepID=A0A8J8SXV3_HALGN|nr:hypothetical protein FGO68_gene1279 [Halteria grandinella]
MSLLKQAYLILFQPYERPSDNKIAIINELLLSAYLITFMFFTEANQNSEILYTCDLALLGIAGLFAVINFGSYIVAALGPLVAKILTWMRQKTKVQEQQMTQERNSNQPITKSESMPVKVKKRSRKRSQNVTTYEVQQEEIKAEELDWNFQNLQNNKLLRKAETRIEEAQEPQSNSFTLNKQLDVTKLESVSANDLSNNFIDMGDNYCYRIEEDDFVPKEEIQRQQVAMQNERDFGCYRFPDQ